MTFVRFFFSFLFLFAGALEVSAQEPILNVGTNFEGHVASIHVYIGSAYTISPYNPSEGTVKEVAERLLRGIAESFVPPAGKENGEFRALVDAYTAPFNDYDALIGLGENVMGNDGIPFQLIQDSTGRWRIPDGVVERAANEIHPRGWIPYNWPWVTKVVIELENKKFDYKATYLSGNGVDPNLQCYISENKLLYLRPFFVVPELQKKSFEDSTTMTLTAYDAYGRWTKVNLRNGFELARSDSPPYRALPKVLQIVRHGDITELSLEGETGAELIVEFRETLGSLEWENIAYPYVLLTSGKRNFSHKTSSDTGFYRVRENILPLKR